MTAWRGLTLCHICFRSHACAKCISPNCHFGSMCLACYQLHHRDTNHKVVELKAPSAVDRCDPAVAERFLKVKDLDEFKDFNESDLINAIKNCDLASSDNAELLKQLKCRCRKCGSEVPQLKLTGMTSCGCELCLACVGRFLRGLPSCAECPACGAAWAGDVEGREVMKIRVLELESEIGTDAVNRVLQVLDEWVELDATEDSKTTAGSAGTRPSFDAELCALCGKVQAFRQCTLADCKLSRLCSTCDTIWHGHPARERHFRIEIQSEDPPSQKSEICSSTSISSDPTVCLTTAPTSSQSVSFVCYRCKTRTEESEPFEIKQCRCRLCMSCFWNLADQLLGDGFFDLLDFNCYCSGFNTEVSKLDEHFGLVRHQIVVRLGQAESAASLRCFDRELSKWRRMVGLIG